MLEACLAMTRKQVATVLGSNQIPSEFGIAKIICFYDVGALFVVKGASTKRKLSLS